MILRDKWGWPLELIKGRPIVNLIRRVILTNWRQTWIHRREGWPMATFSDVGQCSTEQQTPEPK